MNIIDQQKQNLDEIKDVEILESHQIVLVDSKKHQIQLKKKPNKGPENKASFSQSFSKFKTHLNPKNLESFDRNKLGKLGFIFVIFALLALIFTAPFSEIKFKYPKKEPVFSNQLVTTPKIETPVETKPALIETNSKPAPAKTNTSIFPTIRFPDLVSPIKNLTGNFIEQFNSATKESGDQNNLLKNNTTQDLPNLAPSNLSLNPLPDNINFLNDKTVGKVIWQDNANFIIKSDKFLPNTGITVEYNGKISELKVDASGLLPADTVLIVNKDVFKLLGGDPDKNKEIETIVKIK
jgi:hypothetical protein